MAAQYLCKLSGNSDKILIPLNEDGTLSFDEPIMLFPEGEIGKKYTPEEIKIEYQANLDGNWQACEKSIYKAINNTEGSKTQTRIVCRLNTVD